jgi:hypothetical protein
MDWDNTAPEPATLPNRWADVRVALTAGGTDPLTILHGSTVDSVVLSTGDRFLCTGARVDAGIYTVGAGSSTRSTDADAEADFTVGRAVRVREGSTANKGNWTHVTSGAITLGVTTLTISRLTADEASTGITAWDNTAAAAVTL